MAKVGAVAYVVATGMTVYAIVTRSLTHGDDDGADTKSIIALWAVALCLWGFGKGVVDGPVLALVTPPSIHPHLPTRPLFPSRLPCT